MIDAKAFGKILGKYTWENHENSWDRLWVVHEARKIASQQYCFEQNLGERLAQSKNKAETHICITYLYTLSNKLFYCLLPLRIKSKVWNNRLHYDKAFPNLIAVDFP